MGVFFFLDAATSACFVKEEDTLSTIFSKRYLQGTELVSTFDGTTDLPYGTNLEVLGAWRTAAPNGWVLRAARQVTENCFNWTAVHNTFNFAHEGRETFVVVDLLLEEGLQNFPHGANAALPYTTDM